MNCSKSCVIDAIKCLGSLVGCLGLQCCAISPFILVMSIIGLSREYSGAAKIAKGADPDDFVAVGRRCRIEGIDFQAITRVTSTENGDRYFCNERWKYTFVVLEVEDVLNIETDAEYFGLRSLTEERLACNQKSCERCNRLWGKDILYDGQPIVDGYYATECWALKEGVIAHSFWSCSESNIANDTACYLLSDPKEVLDDQLKPANREIMAGWILFALSALAICSFCLISANIPQPVHVENENENEDREDADY